VTVSIGVAVRNEQTRTPEGLLKAADEALFYAKRSGRNFVASTRDLAAARARQANDENAALPLSEPLLNTRR
jgi:predicted signal transduction protein with EAL and GGDEF domain